MSRRPSHERKKRRRRRLWETDPRCRCCGVETVLPCDTDPTDPPSNMATTQHHDPRTSRHRGTMPGEERTTLYCRDCNQRDNDVEQERTPTIVLRARSVWGHVRKRIPGEPTSRNGEDPCLTP